jgi:hypothetical protein
MMQEKALTIGRYLLTKFAGAGFSIFIYFLVILMSAEFDMYDIVENFNQTKMLWFIFYAYGITCSIVIDGLTTRVKKFHQTTKIVLYIVAGFAYFLVRGVNPFTLFAGAVGAIFSLLFYLETIFSKKNVWRRWLFAVVIPLFLITLLSIDFTTKKQWNETRTDNSFQATFSYFHGKHEIPVHLEQGDTLTFTIEFHPTNGGGYGYHVRNKENQYVGITELGENTRSITAKDTGTYYIVVTGHHLSGRITVEWEVGK